MINILVNGKEETIDQQISILELLDVKGIKKEAVAIELNDQIIKKSDYDSVVLKDGDRVEIVSYMGGG